MIGVSAPLVLGAAVLGALLTCVLHFLSVRRPPVLLLPTMRFLPDRPVRAVSRSARPSDLWLLLLRVSALLLAGVALSGMTWRGSGATHGRVVVVTRNVHDISATRAQLSNVLQSGSAGNTTTRLVFVDTTAHYLSEAETRAFKADTLTAHSAGAAATVGDAPTLSALVLAGVRAAGTLVREVRNADSVELVIVAPLTASMDDAALSAVRSTWSGAIQVIDTRSDATNATNSVNTAQLGSSLKSRRVAFAGNAPNDAVVSAFVARGWANANTNATSSNSGVTPNAANVAMTVEWPASGVPTGWTTSSTDTIGAVVARGEALVWPFVRAARLPDSLQQRARAIAWWSDGEIAATEVANGVSCVRQVGVKVPQSSDLLQGRAARALLLALSAPCGGEYEDAPIATSTRTMLEGAGGSASASSFRSATAARTPWAAALLILALVLLLVEWWRRDRDQHLEIAPRTNSDSARKVA